MTPGAAAAAGAEGAAAGAGAASSFLPQATNKTATAIRDKEPLNCIEISI
jgi:hypothetical protein